MTSTDAIHDPHAGDHSHDHSAPSYDDINTPVIVLVGVISALVTLLTIMFVQGMYYHWQNSFVKDRSTKAVSMPANEQIAAQKLILEGGDGVTSIEDAMQAVVKKYSK